MKVYYFGVIIKLNLEDTGHSGEVSFVHFPVIHLIFMADYVIFDHNRPEDIKPELHLNVKNFLFDCEFCFIHMIAAHMLFDLTSIEICPDEPNEWAYGMHEEEGKMIDITDDSTGQVHSLARKHTSIYVNEVGHSPDLYENV